MAMKLDPGADDPPPDGPETFFILGNGMDLELASLAIVDDNNTITKSNVRTAKQWIFMRDKIAVAGRELGQMNNSAATIYQQILGRLSFKRGGVTYVDISNHPSVVKRDEYHWKALIQPIGPRMTGAELDLLLPRFFESVHADVASHAQKIVRFVGEAYNNLEQMTTTSIHLPGNIEDINRVWVPMWDDSPDEAREGGSELRKVKGICSQVLLQLNRDLHLMYMETRDTRNELSELLQIAERISPNWRHLDRDVRTQGAHNLLRIYLRDDEPTYLDQDRYETSWKSLASLQATESMDKLSQILERVFTVQKEVQSIIQELVKDPRAQEDIRMLNNQARIEDHMSQAQVDPHHMPFPHEDAAQELEGGIEAVPAAGIPGVADYQMPQDQGDEEESLGFDFEDNAVMDDIHEQDGLDQPEDTIGPLHNEQSEDVQMSGMEPINGQDPPKADQHLGIDQQDPYKGDPPPVWNKIEEMYTWVDRHLQRVLSPDHTPADIDWCLFNTLRNFLPSTPEVKYQKAAAKLLDMLQPLIEPWDHELVKKYCTTRTFGSPRCYLSTATIQEIDDDFVVREEFRDIPGLEGQCPLAFNNSPYKNDLPPAWTKPNKEAETYAWINRHFERFKDMGYAPSDDDWILFNAMKWYSICGPMDWQKKEGLKFCKRACIVLDQIAPQEQAWTPEVFGMRAESHTFGSPREYLDRAELDDVREGGVCETLDSIHDLSEAQVKRFWELELGPE